MSQIQSTVLDQEEKAGDPRDHIASKGQRFVNYLIDLVVFYVIVFLIGLMLAYNGSSFLDSADDFSGTLFFLGLFILYYVIMEAAFGRTIGKMLTRTYVVDQEGNKPSLGKVLGRSFCRLIPFEPFSLLGDGIGWHDSIPKTFVVKDSIRRSNNLK